MKIIDAVWEKENLGVMSCKEIIFENNDKVKDIEKEFKSVTAHYLVAKVPSPRVDLLLLAQDNGFKFIETNISIQKNLHTVALPKIYKRYEDKIHYRTANGTDIEKILDTVKKGVFIDDKIALDPYFGIEKSANRYYNWIKNDISAAKSIALVVSIDGKEIGFCIVKHCDDITANGMFGALYDEYRASGFGFCIIYASFCYAKANDYKKIISGVSANNLKSLKLNTFCGYDISDTTYVLVKHN
jgi:L-amino acid N-acyltransferase YncA